MNQEEQLRENVKAGGGVWVGIQTAIPPKPSLVEFYSPITDHVMFLPVEECTQNHVAMKVAFDSRNKPLNTVKIPKYKLRLLIDKVRNMEAYIDELLEEKE